MAGQQRFWCPKSYNSIHLCKGMYGSKPNDYRTVRIFRTAFTFSELAGPEFKKYWIKDDGLGRALIFLTPIKNTIEQPEIYKKIINTDANNL